MQAWLADTKKIDKSKGLDFKINFTLIYPLLIISFSQFFKFSRKVKQLEENQNETISINISAVTVETVIFFKVKIIVHCFGFNTCK